MFTTTSLSSRDPGTGAELQQGLARPVLFIAFFLKVTTLILISVRVIRSSPDQRPYDHYCKCISWGCHTHSSASTIITGYLITGSCVGPGGIGLIVELVQARSFLHFSYVHNECTF